MSQIPSRSADAEEVRNYIRHALITKYQADKSLAEEAASSWRLGRGRELHDLSLEYFQQLLGVEVGLCVFASVCEDQNQAWERSLLGNICSGMLYGSTGSVLFSTARIFFGHSPSSLSYFCILFFGASLATVGYSRPKTNTIFVISGLVQVICAVVLLCVRRLSL
ncbi:hypothetical protein BJY04DRAFT_183336 [Aspergillus karnatakaensis]|uniref:uncharacterized protein n=1 Tax=Aspergillus karnatakaensis TaxID=1810916 RepID=UPI003CCDD626